MEASSSNQQFCLRWNNHRTNLLTSFNELWHNGAFADVSFLVESGSTFVYLKCHKMVLAACSTYFERMFAKSDEHHPVIILAGVKEAEMKAILEYMYQGEVSVSRDEMTDIFKVAYMLRIKGLMEYDRSHDIREHSVSPPPAISSTERSASFGNDSLHNDYRSPPHSTSTPSFYPYMKASALANHPANHMPPAGWSPLSSLSLAAQTAMSASLAPRAAALFPGVYETEERHLRKQMNSLILNRDTPILRTVLGQGQADSSQGIPPIHTDVHDVYPSSSNGSPHDMTDGCRSSLDLTHITNANGHSSFSVGVKMEEADKTATTSDQPNRKNKEWKRYKQYTKEHMEKAIKAVKRGETALKASKAYGIPSRTLYDKVKKMGIATQRNVRRTRTSSTGAHFPQGIGGNVDGSIYRGMSDHDNDIENDYSNSMIEGSAALLDIAYGHDREQSEDQEASLDNSMSPDDEHQEEVRHDYDDYVQDLSINRRNVIVPPAIIPIKKEDDDTSKN